MTWSVKERDAAEERDMFFVSLSFDVNADSASPKAWYDHRINHASNTSGMSQRLKKKLLANLLHCQTTLQSLGSQRLHLRTDNKAKGDERMSWSWMKQLE